MIFSIINEILEIINVNLLKKDYIETMKKMPKLSATSFDAVIVMQDYIQKLEKENKKLMIENENFKNINEKNKNKIPKKLDYGIHPIDENTKGNIPKEQTEARKYVKRTTYYKDEPYSGSIID